MASALFSGGPGRFLVKVPTSAFLDDRSRCKVSWRRQKARFGANGGAPRHDGVRHRVVKTYILPSPISCTVCTGEAVREESARLRSLPIQFSQQPHLSGQPLSVAFVIADLHVVQQPWA